MLTRILVEDFVFVGLSPSADQDQPATANAPTSIAAGRPSFTNSSIVVPSGSIQAENGLSVCFRTR